MAAQLPLVKTPVGLTLARPCPDKAQLPTMYDLPSETVGESGLPDMYHFVQGQLLRETCQTTEYTPEQLFIAIDVNLYYDPSHTLWHKRPDWYLALGVSPRDEHGNLRLSYVVWQEEIVPYLVVELLSPSTRKEDLGETPDNENKPPNKWQVYEQILKIPYYIVYDYRLAELWIFAHDGERYQLLNLPDKRWWSEELQLGLGIWSGKHEGNVMPWLRWYRHDGAWVPSQLEQIQQAEQELQQERQRAQQAEQEMQQLTEKLRALGIDVDTLKPD